MRWWLTYLNLYRSINIPTQSPDFQFSPYFSCITLDYSYRRFGFKDKSNESGIAEQYTLGCWAHARWTKTNLSCRYKLLFVTHCQKGKNSWYCPQKFCSSCGVVPLSAGQLHWPFQTFFFASLIETSLNLHLVPD